MTVTNTHDYVAADQSCRLVVLISGGGSNLKAILDACEQPGYPAHVARVISNRGDAGGLDHARNAMIPTSVVDARGFGDRADYDDRLSRIIDEERADLIVLAGFMRVLTDRFVLAYARRLINIHPSLLPAYPGLHTHQRAIDDGATYHGATVHFVIPELDAGPIITQATLPVLAQDTATSLAARVLRLEHIIYPRAVRWFAEGRLTLDDNVVQLDGKPPPTFDQYGRPWCRP